MDEATAVWVSIDRGCFGGQFRGQYSSHRNGCVCEIVGLCHTHIVDHGSQSRSSTKSWIWKWIGLQARQRQCCSTVGIAQQLECTLGGQQQDPSVSFRFVWQRAVADSFVLQAPLRRNYDVGYRHSAGHLSQASRSCRLRTIGDEDVRLTAAHAGP